MPRKIKIEIREKSPNKFYSDMHAKLSDDLSALLIRNIEIINIGAKSNQITRTDASSLVMTVLAQAGVTAERGFEAPSGTFVAFAKLVTENDHADLKRRERK